MLCSSLNPAIAPNVIHRKDKLELRNYAHVTCPSLASQPCQEMERLKQPDATMQGHMKR